MSDLDRKVAQAMGLKSVNNCEEWSNSNMKDPEDEAFEQLALKQGQWEHTSGWRKRQVYGKLLVDAGCAERGCMGYDPRDGDAVMMATRDEVLEEVAVELETKFTMPFGRDTVQSFAQYIRGMKR